MGEDFGTVDPGYTLPCCAVDEAVEVDAYHCEVTSRSLGNDFVGGGAGGVGFEDCEENG